MHIPINRISKPFLLLLITFVSQPIFSQVPHLDILCSDSLAGRGYVHNGDKKAASYIKNEFKKYGLSQIQTQEFDVSVNVFSDTIHLYSLDKNDKTHEPILGKDYIVSPSSKSINTDFFWIELDQDFFSSKRKVKRFIKSNKTHKDSLFAYAYHRDDVSADKVSVDFVRALQQKPFVIELTNNKPILTVAPKQARQTKIIMNDSVFNTISHGLYAKVKAEEKEYQTQNILGVVEGSIKDTFVIVCAHYDHLGMQGQSIYRGANDNATGTAAMLELARRISSDSIPPKYSTIFIAFGAEELGLIGSSFYVQHPIVSLKQTKYLINLDLLGAGSKGITLVNGVEEKSLTQKFNTVNKTLSEPFSTIKTRTNAPNSDHYPFTQENISAVFMYSLGDVGGYHHVDDTIETLEKGSFLRLINLLEGVLK